MESTGPEDAVRVDVHSGVMTITLNRPQTRNAQTPRTWQTLARIGGDVPDTVRAVVVRGEGPSFSAGLDLALLQGAKDGFSFAEMLQADDDAVARQIAGFQQAFTWLRRPGLVTVAAVQGHAVGAGLQLALACDFRVLTTEAQLCMREPSLGMVPDLGGTQPLVECVGYSRALELCLTGRWVGAEEAHATGLATVVVPVAALADTTADLVSAATAPAPETAAATKALLRSATERSFDDQLAAERTAQVRMLRRWQGGRDVAR